MRKLGIIAGAGELPVLLARAAVAHDRKPVVIQITKSDPQRFTGIADELHTYGVGQIQKIAQTLLDSGVKETVIIGKVEKNILLRPFQIDATTVRILVQNRRKKPSAIVNAALTYLESTGLTILTQDRYLHHLLPQPGVLNSDDNLQRINGQILRSVLIPLAGWQTWILGKRLLLKIISSLQLKRLKGRMRLFREAESLGKKGVVVAKASADHHDFRVDVPTVGMQTLEVLHQVKAGVLAVEARRTFVMDVDVVHQESGRI